MPQVHVFVYTDKMMGKSRLLIWFCHLVVNLAPQEYLPNKMAINIIKTSHCSLVYLSFKIPNFSSSNRITNLVYITCTLQSLYLVQNSESTEWLISRTHQKNRECDPIISTLIELIPKVVWGSPWDISDYCQTLKLVCHLEISTCNVYINSVLAPITNYNI